MMELIHQPICHIYVLYVFVLNGALLMNSLTKLWGKKQPILTYREKHDRNGESDGHQHSQPDEQHQDIQGVHSAVGVQQLRLHAAWNPESSA